jgi:hypothetical protein
MLFVSCMKEKVYEIDKKGGISGLGFNPGCRYGFPVVL